MDWIRLRQGRDEWGCREWSNDVLVSVKGGKSIDRLSDSVYEKFVEFFAPHFVYAKLHVSIFKCHTILRL